MTLPSFAMLMSSLITHSRDQTTVVALDLTMVVTMVFTYTARHSQALVRPGTHCSISLVVFTRLKRFISQTHVDFCNRQPLASPRRQKQIFRSNRLSPRVVPGRARSSQFVPPDRPRRSEVVSSHPWLFQVPPRKSQIVSAFPTSSNMFHGC